MPNRSTSGIVRTREPCFTCHIWIQEFTHFFGRRLCPLPTDCRFPSAALDVVPPEAYGRATYLIEKERTGV